MKNARPTEAGTGAAGQAGRHITAPRAFFDDEPPSALPPWPSAHSLAGRFLARLIEGRELTAKDWLAAAKSMRLAAEVHELRELGWLVHADWLLVKTADLTADGRRPARVSQYRLDATQRRQARMTPACRDFLRSVSLFEGGAR